MQLFTASLCTCSPLVSGHCPAPIPGHAGVSPVLVTTAVPVNASQDAVVVMDCNACVGSIGGGGRSCSSSSGGSGSRSGTGSGNDGTNAGTNADTNGRGSGDSNSGGKASSSASSSHTVGAGSEVASSSNCNSGSGSDSAGSSGSHYTSADSSSDGDSSSGSNVSTAETSGGASSRNSNARGAGLAERPVHRSGRAPDVAAGRGSAPARLVTRAAPGATRTNPVTSPGSLLASLGTRPDVAGETSATGAKQAAQRRANNGAAARTEGLQSLGSFMPGLQLPRSFQADARSQRPRGSVPALEGLAWVNQLQPSAQLSFATHATPPQAWNLMATDPAGGRNAGAAAGGWEAAAGRGATGVRGPAAVEAAGLQAGTKEPRCRRSHGHRSRLSAPGHQLLVRQQEQDEKEQLFKRKQRQQQQGSEPQSAGRAGRMLVSVNLEDSSLPVAARAWLQGHFFHLQPSGQLGGSSGNTTPVPRRAAAATSVVSAAAQGARLDTAADQGDGMRAHGHPQGRRRVGQPPLSRAEEGSKVGSGMEGRHQVFGAENQQEPHAHVQDRQKEGVTGGLRIWQGASTEGPAEEQGRSRQRRSGTKPQEAPAVHRDAQPQHREVDAPRRAESKTGKGCRRRSAAEDAEALDARLGAGAGLGGAGDDHVEDRVFGFYSLVQSQLHEVSRQGLRRLVDL